MGLYQNLCAICLAFYVLPFIAVSKSDSLRFPSASDGLDIFEKFVDNVMRCRKVTGASVTMVKNDIIILSKGFGHASIEKDLPATNKTKFCIGSLTKAFTSTVLAKLLSQQHKYSWDTNIQDILGDQFRLVDKLRTENVNLRDLLAHKVGVPGYFNALMVGFPDNTSREDLIRMLEYQPASKPFRTNFIYSNFMYTLAGYVAEQLSGTSWETLVKNMLFQPLGMRNSGFVNEVRHFDSSFASMYTYYRGKPIRIANKLLYMVDPLGPAGSIYSTSEDMGKWIQFHLTSGKNSTGSRIIPEAVLKELNDGQMARPFSNNDLFRPTYPIEDVSLSYNLGWVTSTYRGYERIWHSGGIVGYSSLLWLFPAKKVGIFISITGSENSDNVPIKMIMHRAADFLLEETPWLNDTTACTFPQPWESPEVKPRDQESVVLKTLWNISRPKEDYVGVYGHPAFGNISITIENTTNLILYFGRFGKLLLNPITMTKFKALYLEDLWYVTQCDGAEPPLIIQFKFFQTNVAQTLLYPVDGQFNIEFSRDCLLREKSHISIYNPCSTSTGCTVAGAYLWIMLHLLTYHNLFL